MIEKIDFKGIKAVRILNNKKDEIILIYGVGPRIISYKPEGKGNLFYINERDFSSVNIDIDKWKIYGGTRLWTSVESKWSYTPDNQECTIEIGDNYVIATTKPNTVNQLQKSIKIEPINDFFKITYLIKNSSQYLLTAGIWALSCLKPTNDAKIYLPWGENSEWNVKDMKYWRSWLSSNSNIESEQWNPTNEYFIIKPTGETGKVGFANRWGFAMFKNDITTFIKMSEYIEGANYPDDGCSFETYTSADFYELETLSPIYTMKPEKTYVHTELWWAGSRDIPTETIEESYKEIKKLFM